MSWCYKKGCVFSCSSAVLDVSAQINQHYISHEWQLTFLGHSSGDELATALRKHANVLSSTSVRQDFWGGWRDGGYWWWKVAERWAKSWCSQSIQEFGHCLVLVENVLWGSGVTFSLSPTSAGCCCRAILHISPTPPGTSIWLRGQPGSPHCISHPRG